MEKINLIVIDGHTLGYTIPNTNYAGVLHSSVLKGGPGGWMNNVVLTGKDVRPASEQDFNDFRVSFKGFDNKNEYEYASN